MKDISSTLLYKESDTDRPTLSHLSCPKFCSSLGESDHSLHKLFTDINISTAKMVFFRPQDRLDVPQNRFGSDCSHNLIAGGGLRYRGNGGLDDFLDGGGRMPGVRLRLGRSGDRYGHYGGLGGRGRLDDSLVSSDRRGALGGNKFIVRGGYLGQGLGSPLSMPRRFAGHRRDAMDRRGSLFDRGEFGGLDRGGLGPRDRFGGGFGGLADIGGFADEPMMSGALSGGLNLRGRRPSLDSLRSGGSQYSVNHLDRRPRNYHWQPPFVEDEDEELALLQAQHELKQMGIYPDYEDSPLLDDLLSSTHRGNRLSNLGL
jgi:hypothetical protein